LSGTAVSLVGGDPGVPMSHSNPCACGPFCNHVFYDQTFPSPVTRGVNSVPTLVSANKHSWRCGHKFNLSGEAKERQQLPCP
jgi:hypothetical protein